MTTWRHPTYMRRRLMRLMAEEQQREQQRQFQRAAAQLYQVTTDMAALLTGQPAGLPLDPLDAALEAAADADGQRATLRKHVH